MLQLKKNIVITILSIFLVFISCSKNNDVSINNQLELIASYKTNVSEPSGLAINSTGTVLYTVSDNTNKIYKLSTAGNILQTFNYIGNDLEGVSLFTDTKLLLAEERTKEIVEYDMSTSSYQKHKIEYENNDENSGIEGVSYNANDNSIFILNEKNPGLLMRLRSNYSIISTYKLNFASDYSGIFYESSSNNLWIVSDQNKTINKCNLVGELIKSYPISVTKAEGIAVTNDKIYIVSDLDSKLYIFKKPIE